MLSTRNLMLKKSTQVQLVNLGRILTDPKILDTFEVKDFSDHEIRGLIRLLKSDMERDGKDAAIEEFMLKIGCSPWRSTGANRSATIEESQKMQAKEWFTKEAVRRLGSDPSITEINETIEEISRW